VLLARKKRGFGAGMIIGFGGKPGRGESEAECTFCAMGEEAGIAVQPDSLAWRAQLSFVFPARRELDAMATVFFGQEWAGEPRESEEMAPEWFDVGSLPLDQTWDDEAYWLPRVMASEALAGVITYDDACTLVAHAELRAAERKEEAEPTHTRANKRAIPPSKRPSQRHSPIRYQGALPGQLPNRQSQRSRPVKGSNIAEPPRICTRHGNREPAGTGTGAGAPARRRHVSAYWCPSVSRAVSGSRFRCRRRRVAALMVPAW
jgi:8-oxo-dGTP diphosphatase